MANISREEERQIKEWQQKYGGRRTDRIPSTEERIADLDAEVATNLAILRRMRARAERKEAGRE